MLYQIWLGRNLLKAKEDIKENLRIMDEITKEVNMRIDQVNDQVHQTLSSEVEELEKKLDKLDSRLDKKVTETELLIEQNRENLSKDVDCCRKDYESSIHDLVIDIDKLRNK